MNYAGRNVRMAARVLCLVSIVCGSESRGQEVAKAVPYITTTQRLTLLSANDGEIHFLHTTSGVKVEPVSDTITVIHMGPDHPPVCKTVTGVLPVTIYGSPHIAITRDGRYGFVANHSWRGDTIVRGDAPDIPDEHLSNVLSVIDLSAADLALTDQVKLPSEPWMVDLHPDGKRAIVSVGASFRVYSVRNGRAVLDGEAKAPGVVLSFDVSPTGDRIVAVIVEAPGATAKSELHVFGLEGGEISHLSQVSAPEGFGATDRLFSPRISPDGTTAIVLNDLGIGGKGTLDDVLVAKVDGEKPVFTQRVESIGDGLESLAFHPSGKFAVVSCLDKGPDAVTTSHLAVLDLTKRRVRLLYHISADCIPEGIEFSPSGKKLFVQSTLGNHIMVFDVQGFMLRKSPFVLRTGHGPASMAVAPRFTK